MRPDEISSASAGLASPRAFIQDKIPDTQVSSSVLGLSAVSERLSILIGRLEESLSPVLRPLDRGKELSQEEKPSLKVALAATIGEQTRSVGISISRIESIIERLEL